MDLTVGTYNVVGVSNIHYRPMDAAMSSWTSYNGLVNTINYDQDLRPTSISVPGVQSLSFAYDAADRITKITNGMDATMTETLGYDALSRLTSVVSGADNESFTYDADGNRLTANINGVAWTYTPASNSNRLTGASSSAWSGSYSYDAQGNMLGTAHQYWAYDSFGRMRTATPFSGSPVTTYDVNPEGQRLRKYTSSTSTYFAPDVSGNLLAEKINGTWYDYVWLNGRMVEVIANGGVFSLHDDQTGRPQVMTEPNGTSIDWAAQNKPFDRTVTTNAWGPFNIGFPGQYNDTEVGDYWYNGARDYSPGLGRYLESDPIGLLGGINTYAYVGDNPISNVDPAGLCEHKYNITVFTLCSASTAFSMAELPLVSAPGAPAAQEGFTPSITLWDTPFSGEHGNNRISQYVNSSTMTIVNTTLPGHTFYPGTVTWQVTPGPLGFGSFVSIIGTGDGPNPMVNDAVGLGFFGGAASAIAAACAAMSASGQ